jgi:carboxymethylenebutenolidase
MKRQNTIIFLVIAAISLVLPLTAGTSGTQNSSQNRPPQPLPPRNSNGPRGEPTPRPSPTPCPGLRECTAEENNTPTQLHIAFPGPDGRVLHGHLYVPGVNNQADLAAVTTKYPAMIYNHGSELNPNGVPHLAKLYLDHGYVFFAPHRHGQGLSKDAGPYHIDEQNKYKGTPEFGKMVVKLHELYNKDVIAAVEWFKSQPYVEPNHIAMTGISFGGIQTLLTAEKDPDIRAYVPFAPAAMSWGVPELRERLGKAVHNEKAPMFMIQAEGDYNLGPVTTLGDILVQKGNATKWKPKLYPRFGCTNEDAHARFAMHCDGIVIWDQDVLAFLNKWVK